jgi:hypothetical protein
MIELAEAAPEVEVQPAEYARLLGYPRDRELEGRAAELAAWAREWYATHGRPWIYARQAAQVGLRPGSVEIEGVTFNSTRVHDTLRRAGADLAVVAAVSAGGELEEEAQRLWRDERPDEYFFLEIFGSAVVEHLITMTGARLCAWADSRRLAVLPHYSPGYPEWDISEQRQLREVAPGRPGGRLPGPLEVLDSGALNPKKSLLAVFGITRHTETVRRLTELIPCENCSFHPCQYRRAPYARALQGGRTDVRPDGTSDNEAASVEPNVSSASYAVNVRALRRWAAERLSLAVHGDGTVDALFRYDGTTCTNMGRVLAFEYAVTLGPREEGYPIREQRCGPAPEDTGHTYMCEYLKQGSRLLDAVRADTPLLGQPLDAVLLWRRPVSAAACYCEPESRQHKWGLVLETIHYALAHRGELDEDVPRAGR